MLVARSQLHGIIDDLQTIASKMGPYVNTLVRISNDPALPQFMARIETVADLESGSSSTSTSTSVTKNRSGVGLKNFIAPLDAYIYARRNPWVPWAAVGAVLLVIGGVGYRLGQRSAVR